MKDTIINYIKQGKFLTTESYKENNDIVGFYQAPEGLLMIRIDADLLDKFIEAGEPANISVISLPSGVTLEGKAFIQYEVLLTKDVPKPKPNTSHISDSMAEFYQDEADRHQQDMDDFQDQYNDYY